MNDAKYAVLWPENKGLVVENAQINFYVVLLMSIEQKIQGVFEGDADIKTFIPKLIEYYKNGKFPIEKIIQTFDFSDINETIHVSEGGSVVKAVAVMPQS